MKIKVLVHITETKHDTYGNTYAVARIVNPLTCKSFETRIGSEGNLLHILRDAIPRLDGSSLYVTSSDTGSTRLSSLPETTHRLNDCHYGADWKKALNSIGFRGLASAPTK